MKTSSTTAIIRFWPLLALLLAPACHKKEDPEPAKATLLVAHPWKATSTSLVLNGYEGTHALTGNDAYTLVFSSDGKLTQTNSSGNSTLATGTWTLQNNDTQLVLQTTSSAQTFQLFELTASKFSYGLQYDAAAIQQQQAAGTAQLLSALILSAGSYTFPANTPTIQANQVTSLQYKANYQQ